MTFRVGVRSDIGRARRRNEDSFLVDAPLFAVADGMGGHRGGNVASAMTLEQLGGAEIERGGPARLTDAIRAANRAVLERGESDRDLSGMGTTITAVLLEGDRGHFAHVGDSRAYLLRDGTLHQITEDHTVVQRLVREGRLQPDEAGRHPQRSILTRALGVEYEVEVDERTVDLLPGDRVLLCSDGLYGMVSDTDIREVLAVEEDPQTACDRLVDLANEAGGEDNITVIVLDVVAGPVEGDGSRPVQAVATETDAEVPTRPRRRRVVGWTLVAAALLAAVVVGARVYLGHQWYVGESNGHVAVYNGIPARFLWFDLSHVDSTTTLPAASAEALQPWQDLRAGITATSRQDALAIVQRIRQDLCPAGSVCTGATPGPGPTPTPTPSPSGTPTPGTTRSGTPTPSRSHASTP
jgi:protein phosphatase